MGFLATSLTLTLLPWLVSLAASSRKSLGGSNRLPLAIFNAAEMFWYPSPVSELYGQFLRPHGLFFAQPCTVNCGTLYSQVCAFPNHVQSNEFTPGGLQWSYINIKDDQWKQDASELHLESHSKGNTYVNKVCFSFFYYINLQTFKTSFCFVIMG